MLRGQHHPIIRRPCGQGLLCVVIPLLQAGDVDVGLQGLLKENSEIPCSFIFTLNYPKLAKRPVANVLRRARI